MMKFAAAALAALAAASCVAAADPRLSLIWPPPREIEVSGGHLPLASALQFTYDMPGTSGVLERAILRTKKQLQGHAARRGRGASLASTRPLTSVHIALASANETLGLDTDYSYEVHVSASSATVSAATPFGALYGLAALEQLSGGGGPHKRVGMLPHSTIHIRDAPVYQWRGLMLDAGRRFFPVALVEQVLDGMALAKMNVLHLHASDMCRFGVESHTQPSLTAALTGILGGFYTQADIASLEAYAADRGIRVVPEFDVPGHSRGLLPLQAEGMQFCQSDNTKNQVFNDDKNVSYPLVAGVMQEMAGLFSDQVFSIGADETSVVGPCTLASTFAFERNLLQYVEGSLGKTPAGWEEILFDAGAATPNTIVYSWSRHWPPSIIDQGYRTVASNGSHFYLTRPAGAAYPAGWASFWYDIAEGVNATGLPLLLGGEASQWTDTYCYTEQCGAYNGPAQYGAPFFPPSADASFSTSIGGMIFPRALVAAASFWGYNASVSSADPSFVAGVEALNQQLQDRGVPTCPNNCTCDQLNQCGKPIPLPAPPAGATLALQDCALPLGPTQQWTLLAGGQLALSANTSLCVLSNGTNNVYPLTLGDCGSADAGVWRRGQSSSNAEIVHAVTGVCIDARTSDGAVGVYTCGSGQPGLVQTNQAWALDAFAGALTTLDAALAQANGNCVTAVGSGVEALLG